MTGRGSLRALVVIGVVLSLVLCPLLEPAPTLAEPPSATNPFPSNGAIEVGLTPTLHADFSDADEDHLVDSVWQIGLQTLQGSAGDLTSCHVSAGLMYSTRYDWHVSFTDNAGESYVSPVWSFTTMAEPQAPPAVTTEAASGIGPTSATLNGNLSDLGTAGSLTVKFEWGLTVTYDSATTAESMTAEGGFSASLSGLAPDTTYHFRAVASSDDGADEGNDLTFATDAAPTQAPSVATAAASGIGSTSATLNGNLGDMGTAASVAVYFQWGPTVDYGYTTPSKAMDDTGSMSYAVSGLAPETTYHFRAVAEGDGSDNGADRTFITQALPDEVPAVTTRAASAIGTTSATLNLNLAGLGSAASVQVYFEWGLTMDYGNTTTPRTVRGTGSSSYALSGLLPETTYHFRARAEGDGTVQGEDLSFTTSGAPAAPPAVATVAAGDIGTTSATLNLELTALGSAAAVQVSFEWGLTTDYGQTSPGQAMEGTGSLSQPISGLAAASTYHFRAVAVGDGTAYGGDLAFTTGSAPAAPPRVKTGDVPVVSTESARLDGELTSLGSASSVTVSFVWGTSPGGPYPNETPGTALGQGGAFHADLDGLALATTYYVQARAVGDGISYGVEKSFTTAGLAPRIDSLMAYKGQQGTSLMLKITGANLAQATTVDLGDGVKVRGFTVVSESEIRAEVFVDTGAKSGGRQLAVTTPSGTVYYSVPAGFLAGVPGDAAEPDTSARSSMWIYMVVVAVGLVGTLLVVPLEVALWRRHRR